METILVEHIPVKVTKEDHLLTLSTCTNSPSKRYLVVAKLVDYVEYEGQEAP